MRPNRMMKLWFDPLGQRDATLHRSRRFQEARLSFLGAGRGSVDEQEFNTAEKSPQTAWPREHPELALRGDS